MAKAGCYFISFLLTICVTWAKWDCLDLETMEYYGDINYLYTTDDLDTIYQCLPWSDVPSDLLRIEYDEEYLKENYCRVLRDRDRGARCFFVDHRNVTRKYYCRVPPCKAHSGCVNGTGENYRDNGRYTNSGHLCIHWRNDYNLTVNPDTYPDSALDMNYCRNPDNSSGPWCYYEVDNKVHRDECRIKQCKSNALTEFIRHEEVYIPGFNTKYIEGYGVTTEDCAIRCLEEASFVCRGFEYREVWPFSGRLCILTSENTYTLGIHKDPSRGTAIDLFTRVDTICDAFVGSTIPRKCPLLLTSNRHTSMSMSASSSYSLDHIAEYAVLHSSKWWRPSDSDQEPWIQICFSQRVIVSGLFLQGSGTEEFGWVEKFSISYSLDSVNWWFIRDYQNVSKNIVEFTGNAEPSCVKTVIFGVALRTKCLRLRPVTGAGVIGLRMDVIGCLDNDCDTVVGLSTDDIPDTSFSTSSTDGISTHSPHMARVSPIHETIGGWVPETTAENVWLQIDLLRDHRIHAIVSQGCEGSWVTQYTVTYFRGGEPFVYTDGNLHDSTMFEGNTDEVGIKINYVERPFITSTIRVTPTAWDDKICLRLEFVGCVNKVCSKRLGVESGQISDDQLSASSWFPKMPFTSVRLNYEKWEGLEDTDRACWGSRVVTGTNEYLQIDLERLHTVTGIITQGSGDDSYYIWVTSYRLDYLSQSDGEYRSYLELDGTEKVFTANFDQNTEILTVLDRPVVTSAIRIKPYTWVNVIPCMRLEVVGCLYDGTLNAMIHRPTWKKRQVGDVCDLDKTFEFDGYCYGSIGSQLPDACPDIFSEKSSLVTIKSDATFNYLQETARYLQMEHQKYYKIGLESVAANMSTNSSEEVVFMWEDGTPQTLPLFRHSLAGLHKETQYCVQMLLFDNLKWDAYDCSSTSLSRASVCQIDINECIGSRNTCEYSCFNTPGTYFCYCPPGMLIDPENQTRCVDVCDFIIQPGRFDVVLTDVASSSCVMYHSTGDDFWRARDTCARSGANFLQGDDDLYAQNFTLNGTFTSWINSTSSSGNNDCSYISVTTESEVTRSSVECNQSLPFACISEFEQLSCHDVWSTGEVKRTNAPMGSIVAATYGPYYHVGSSCNLDISGPVGLFIRITIHTLILRRESAGSECEDELIITDVDSNGLENNRGTYNGNITNHTVISRSNHVKLELRIGCFSANMPDLIGFQATYSFIDCNAERCETGCTKDQEYTSASGQVPSLGFPMQLPSFSRCTWTIRSPVGMFIELTFNEFDIRAAPDGHCMDSLTIFEPNRSLVLCGDQPPLYISSNNEITLTYETGLDVLSNGFQASYEQTDRRGCRVGDRSCNVDYVCDSNAGVLTSPGYPFSAPPSSECIWNIATDPRTFIEIEFVVMNVPQATCLEDFVEIIGLSGNTRRRFCSTNSHKSLKLRSSRNRLQMKFISGNELPTDVMFYADYKAKRFRMDAVNESSTQQSMDHCPESWAFWNRHCYRFVEEDEGLVWVEAEEKCENANGTLVSISTREEMEFIQYMLTNFWITDNDQVYIGLTDRMTDGSFRWIDGRPLSYSDWFYDRENILFRQPNDGFLGGCSVIMLSDYGSTSNWHDIPCASPETNQYICKKKADNDENSNDMDSLIGSVGRKDTPGHCLDHLFTCGSGECIHRVFVCDMRVDCADASDEVTCFNNCSNEMISCGDGLCVSSSFICDYVDDCPDGRDEFHCEYPDCASSDFRCDNGECINESLRCDLHQDCADRSDESFCEFCSHDFQCYDGSCIPPRAVCDGILDCQGVRHEDEVSDCDTGCPSDHFNCSHDSCTDINNVCVYGFDSYQLQIGCRDLSHLTNCAFFDCPSSTFKCPGSYCIQLQLRCNGEWDCPDGEDETFCENFNCPGAYNCHGSQSCVGLHQLCNGINECPRDDDELFCDVVCPDGCQCTGLVFKCGDVVWDANKAATLHRSVRVLVLNALSNAYRGVRSINGEDSIARSLYLNLFDFPFLVKLDISSNGLQSLRPQTFSYQRNLRQLSLANNEIAHLETNTFAGLEQLVFLNLSGNPLSTISPGAFWSLVSLPQLNLGGLKLSRLEGYSFEGLESVETVDLSFNGIRDISRSGFRGLNKTTILNLTNNPIESYAADFLDDLPDLKELYSDIFLFCCMRPDLAVCRPEPGPFSSCNDLIRSPRLRIFMWILGLSAFIGNISVIFWRIKSKEKNKIQSFLIFNLAISDCMMGIYMLIIASADVHFRDVYVYHAAHWRSSFTCSLAGVLSVISSEVSVYILTLISVDRFLCVLFPFRGFKLSRKRASVALAIGWACGAIIAVLPVMRLPYFGDAYYGRSGVCLAIPLDNSRTPGWIFSVTIFLGFNFVCLVLIAVCYITIIVVAKRSARSIRSNKTLANDLKLASRTAMIVSTDMLCWLPIVIIGILGTSGYVEVPATVYAWTAIFILPINSSINPYLYTFSTIRRRQKQKTLSYENGRSYCSQCSNGNRRVALHPGAPNNRAIKLCGGGYSDQKSLNQLPGNLCQSEIDDIKKALNDAVEEIHSLDLHPKRFRDEMMFKKETNGRWRVFVSLPFTTGRTDECTCHGDVNFIVKGMAPSGVEDTEI